MTENIMENIIENEEIITAIPEEIVPVAKSFTGLKITGVAAATLAVGYGIYKGVKWVAPKIKAKKAAKENLDENGNVVHIVDIQDETVEDTAEK